MVVVDLQQVHATEVEELMCSKLWQFRLQLEAQAGEPITDLKVPVALLLSDLCVFVGLSEEQHARVLGQQGVEFVNGILETRVRKATSGRGGAARQ